METLDFLAESVTVLATAVVVVLLSARVRIPPVVGFLICGVLIGPSGLKLVPEAEEVEVFAEIGVALLLFVIGLQLNPAEMRLLGRSFLMGGSLQWLLTTSLTMGVAIGFGLPLPNALFIGFIVSLSSTAVVLKEYQERRQTTTPQGRVVLGVLLFQDLLIVPMIALAPVLGGTIELSPLALIGRFGGGLAAVAAVFLLARLLMPRLIRMVVATGVRELFILGGLATCLALAWFTARLEFSIALGAFLAGILVAETDYSHQVIADIGPFRDLFASVFFISIGMLVDLSFALANLPLLAGLALLLVVGKALVAFTALKLAGFTLRVALICGLGLAQIGEFSFVLIEVGRSHGLLQGGRFQVLLVAAVLTVALTPFLVRVAPALASRLVGLLPDRPRRREAAEDEELSDHVVIAGYGMTGALLARVLAQTHISYLVVELHPDRVREARAAAVPLLFGDVSGRSILERAGVARARMVVFAFSDLETVMRGLQATRELAPQVEILVSTRRLTEIERVKEVGADQVVAEEFESAIEIFTRVLGAYHVPRNVIRAETRALRGESYRMLRSAPIEPMSEAVLAALEAGTTDIYRVGESGRAVGRNLQELDLRRRTGSSVIAVVRGDEPHPNPSSGMTLEAGDHLVLVGSHAEVDAAFRFLDGPGSSG